MNKSHFTSILAIISLSSGACAMAQNVSVNEYKDGEKTIAAEYKAAKANCASFAGNARDICMAEAKGKEKVARAELKARYKPSKKSDYEISVAKAQADYAVAKEKCDDRAGKARNACVKEAKTVLARARADAKEQLFLVLKSEIKTLESNKVVAREQLKTSGSSATTDAESSAAPMKAKE